MQKDRDIDLPQFQVSCSLTIYVCCSRAHAKPIFYIGRSTNAEDFATFLRLVVETRINKDKKLWVVLDGHAAHRTEAHNVRTMLTNDPILPFYVTRGCSWFNS